MVLEKALQKGHNISVILHKVLVLGVAGGGKTTLKCKLINKDLPKKRKSTGIAEESIQIPLLHTRMNLLKATSKILKAKCSEMCIRPVSQTWK